MTESRQMRKGGLKFRIGDRYLLARPPHAPRPAPTTPGPPFSTLFRNPI